MGDAKIAYIQTDSPVGSTEPGVKCDVYDCCSVAIATAWMQQINCVARDKQHERRQCREHSAAEPKDRARGQGEGVLGAVPQPGCRGRAPGDRATGSRTPTEAGVLTHLCNGKRVFVNNQNVNN